MATASELGSGESLDQPLNCSPDGPGGLLPALVGDGRSLLILTALGLLLSGIFALFLAATSTFLPQDIAFLGMDPRTLCMLHQCRIVHFMFHDRVSFGGTLLSIGTLYLWLLAFPLRQGREWAWWTLMISGTVGFLSFLAYLLYGYLDSWHAVASLGMLPFYIAGMVMTRRLLPPQREGLRSLIEPGERITLRTLQGLGKIAMIAVGAGMTLAGSVISILGATVVFVPQDITYLGFSAQDLTAISPHLVPLIAHDRSGFGGGLCSCGLAVLLIAWKAPLSRALWQALLVGGLAGFGCTIGIHYPMRYLTFSHLLPAYIGAGLYAFGITCLGTALFQVRNHAVARSR